MELYVEHYDLKIKYDNAKNKVDNLLEKKASLFYSTQPNAVKPKDIVINSNASSDKYLNYCGRIENIDNDIENAKKLLELRTEQLQSKESELKNSYEILDKVYYFKNIEKMKISYIAKKTGYSRQQTYRYLKEIKNNCNLVTQ